MSIITTDLVIAISMSIVLAVGGYFKSRPTGEEFDINKFGTTIVFGILIGAGVVITGQPINQQTILIALTANAGAIYIAELGWKVLYRNLNTQQHFVAQIKEDKTDNK